MPTQAYFRFLNNRWGWQNLTKSKRQTWRRIVLFFFYTIYRIIFSILHFFNAEFYHYRKHLWSYGLAYNTNSQLRRILDMVKILVIGAYALYMQLYIYTSVVLCYSLVPSCRGGGWKNSQNLISGGLNKRGVWIKGGLENKRKEVMAMSRKTRNEWVNGEENKKAKNRIPAKYYDL